MQTFSQAFTGADTWKLNVAGSYFTVIGATNVVNIRFFKGGRKLDLGDITGILPGIEVMPRKAAGDDFAFDRVEIDVTAADTVTIGIGNGEARYNRGASSVTVTNTPNVAVTNTPNVAVTSVTRQADPFYDDYSASYKSVTALAANTPETVFAPAANANGAILYTAAFYQNAAGLNGACFIAKTSAPTTIIDGDPIVPTSAMDYNAAGPNNFACGKSEANIFIPAGKGLYFISGNAETIAYRSALYKLL